MSDKEHIVYKNRKIGKESNFNFPNDYFKSFNEKVLLKINLQKEEKSKVVERKTWEIVRPQLIFAASFIGLAIIIYSGINFILGEQSAITPSNTYITELIELEINNFSESMLYEMIESPTSIDFTDNSMNEIIIEYLVNTKIDFELLFKEL